MGLHGRLDTFKNDKASAFRVFDCWNYRVCGGVMTDQRYQKLFGHYPKRVLTRFKQWHSENPEVYKEFNRLARKMISTGRKKYGAEIIINQIRWERDLKTKGDVFKINNDFKPILARLFIYNNPQYEGFFELRVQSNAKYVSSQEERDRTK